MTVTRIPFTKMVGTGNDFLIIDTTTHRHFTAPKNAWRHIAVASCDRHTGVGADGMLILESSHRADVRMRVLNPDGSAAEMCGNGARCVALYLTQRSKKRRHAASAASVTIDTKAGILSATVKADGRVAMRMMDPAELQLGIALSVGQEELTLGFVNTGVPHAVVPVRTIGTVDVDRLGRTLRHHEAFAPRGANVNFIQSDPARANRLLIRTYERGVEAETLACGTGVVASAIVYELMRHGYPGQPTAMNGATAARRRVTVQTRSGDRLRVSFRIETAAQRVRVTEVVMEGRAHRICDGYFEWPIRRNSWR